MSMLNWVWDIGQDSKISEQEEQIKELEQRVVILEQWIRYLQERLEKENEPR